MQGKFGERNSGSRSLNGRQSGNRSEGSVAHFGPETATTILRSHMEESRCCFVAGIPTASRGARAWSGVAVVAGAIGLGKSVAPRASPRRHRAAEHRHPADGGTGYSDEQRHRPRLMPEPVRHTKTGFG